MGAAETAATGRTAASSMASADEWRRQIQFVHLRSCPTLKNLEHAKSQNELDSASLTQPRADTIIRKFHSSLRILVYFRSHSFYSGR